MSTLPESEPDNAVDNVPTASQLQRKKKQSGEKQSDAKKPNKWRTYASWVLILVLGVAAAAEFRAQSAHAKTLRVCNAALEGERRVSFDDLKGNLPPNPAYTKEIHSFAESGVYTWSWQGVRRYKVRLFVDPKQGTVWDVASEP